MKFFYVSDFELKKIQRNLNQNTDFDLKILQRVGFSINILNLRQIIN